ncbi:Retrovirus-related Pol poly from transposon, partial [Paramuricea clavata]
QQAQIVTLAQRWEKWTKSLDYYLRASGVTDQKQKRAVLLHLAGPDVQEVFETLPNTGDDYKTALEKLNEYFQPKRNIPFERHVFRQASQQPDESMDVFVTRLRTLSKTCVFGEQTDEAIRDQAIDKCVSKELRRRLLREPDIDLSKLLTISRAFEQSHFQAQEMEQYNTENSGGSRRETPSHINNTGASRGPCYCCGNTGHRAKDVRCPANGKTCRSCNKVGHFASALQSLKIELDEQSRHYTTFATHTGLYRYKRLMFGVSAAPEIYQHVIQQSLQGSHTKKNRTSNSVMAHFDPSAHTQFRVDASPFGLGAILTQTHGDETRPVAYASRTLTAVEKRYSQTEREALAVLWGCERFHLYLYGTTFDIYTDHKPLEIIYSPTSKPPARIERWGLRLQPYKFCVKYSPGIGNPANVLSRLPLPNATTNTRNTAEEYVQFVAQNAAPKALSLSTIKEATNQDPVLQFPRECIMKNNWPKVSMTRPYHGIRHDRTVIDDIILRGSRILMPTSLRERNLKLIHEGHQGIIPAPVGQRKSNTCSERRREIWKEELDVFLLNYRSTPHCTTGKPPATLLFGRHIRNKIPVPPTSTPADDIPVTVRQHDRERKEKIKSYADDHNRASSSDVKKGDTVLLRQPRQTKLSTTYDPKPYIVEEKKGPSVLLKRPFERQIMRNESMIRKIPDGKDDGC